jgi:alpha-beta hydrolase superfamily lysophospholipase
MTPERPISIPYLDGNLTGSVALVPRPDALVLIANDHGSSRHDPAQRVLLDGLRRGGFATLLVDLILPAEAGAPEQAAFVRTETAELARRIRAARAFVEATLQLSMLPLVLFGEGAGADAVLLSASARPAGVAAVVARGSRNGSKPGVASLRVPLLVCAEQSPEAGARSVSAWIRSELLPRARQAAAAAV